MWQAVRILNLLEQHHKKLGQIMKSTHEHPPVEQPGRPNIAKEILTQTSAQTRTSGAQGPDAVVARATSPETTAQPPRLPRTSRLTGRDLSSSIASNLATARGIPGTQRRAAPSSPGLNTQHASGKFAGDEIRSRSPTSLPGKSSPLPATSNDRRPSWTPPAPVPMKDEHAQETERQPTSDAPFQQFYSTFESLMSKLSAPLAFAGLPLTSTQPAVSPEDSGRKAESTPAARKKPPPKSLAAPSKTLADSMDYSQLISKAALRAVRDGAPGHNPQESFYIVPTEGGTVSYADITRREHQRHLSNISEDTDDFVDARETNIPSPIVAVHSRRGTGRSAGSKSEEQKVGGKTMEEIALENQTLRQYLDITTKRLRVFELSAQSSSAALAQSIRSLQRSPAPTPENSRSGGHHRTDNSSSKGKDEGPEKRIAELEEILKKNDKELQRRDKENAKLKDVVVRYREKWEKLKEGARARREGGERTPRPGEEVAAD